MSIFTGLRYVKKVSILSGWTICGDDVLNDINDSLAEENGENDKIGHNLDELCGEEEDFDSIPSEEWLEEEQQSEEPEENVNRQQ